jgi:hypothetical protein
MMGHSDVFWYESYDVHEAARAVIDEVQGRDNDKELVVYRPRSPRCGQRWRDAVGLFEGECLRRSLNETSGKEGSR